MKTAKPTSPAGTYFVIVEADPEDLNNNPNRANNVAVSTRALTID